MLPRLNPSYQATHQSGGTKAALSQCLLALLYMSQDALLLCAHIFFRVSLSLHLHLSLSLFLVLHLSLALPLSHWWFVFLLWDLGSHSLRAHYSALIHSRGWAPRGRMGDCGYSPLFLLSPAPPLLAPCHAMMSWLLFAPGVPIDSLSVLHTLYLPLPPPYTLTNLHSCFPQPVPFPDSFASQKAPGGFGDVWMLFSTSTKHAWHPERDAINPANPTATPI